VHNMTFFTVEQVSKSVFGPPQYFEEDENRFQYGVPTCVKIIPDKWWILGTTQNKILIYNWEETNVKILRKDPKNEKSGNVTCLDMSEDEKSIVAGYENGWIIL